MRDDFDKITLILENDERKREITIDLNENIYKSRISKAIDFLNKECCYEKDLGYCDDLWCDDIPKLIEILKGEDNEKEN